jgi:hypothetical protein
MDHASWFRARSSSDVSPFGFETFSPTVDRTVDPYRFSFDGGQRGSSLESFFPELRISEKSRSSSFKFVHDTASSCTLECETFGDSRTSANESCDLSYDFQSVSEDFLLVDKPWESVSLEEVNQVPSHIDTTSIDGNRSVIKLGRFKRLLELYLRRVLASAGMSEEQTSALVNTKITTPELLQLASLYGLSKLAFRLHLENAGEIAYHPVHQKFINYMEDRHKHHREQARANLLDIGEHLSADGDGKTKIEYFPGIRLTLGKERDTIIRPMLTAIYRENRPAFRAALSHVGLKYSDLRLWKDHELCTALHIADSFKPGIWCVATDLHLRKTSNKSTNRRSRKRLS